MLTLNQISVNLSRENQNAKRIEDIAGTIDNLAGNRIDEIMQGLKREWKGDSARLYIENIGRLQDRLKSRAKELRKIAQDIRNKAKSIYETEKRNIEIASRNDKHNASRVLADTNVPVRYSDHESKAVIDSKEAILKSLKGLDFVFKELKE